MVKFDKDHPRPKHDLIYLIKRNKKLTPTKVRLIRKRGKIVLLGHGVYDHDSAWCMILAKKDAYFLVEYTCPFTRIQLREWVHENFIDTLGEPWD